MFIVRHLETNECGIVVKTEVSAAPCFLVWVQESKTWCIWFSEDTEFVVGFNPN